MKKLITFALTALILAMPYAAKGQITSDIQLCGINVGENGLRIIDDGTLMCSVSTSEGEEAWCILATYTQDNLLYNVKTVPVYGNAQLTYCFDAENESYAKLLFWSSCEGGIPLRAHIDFNQTSGINAYYYDAQGRMIKIDKADGTSIVYTYDKSGNMLTKTKEE